MSSSKSLILVIVVLLVLVPLFRLRKHRQCVVFTVGRHTEHCFVRRNRLLRQHLASRRLWLLYFHVHRGGELGQFKVLLGL